VNFKEHHHSAGVLTGQSVRSI